MGKTKVNFNEAIEMMKPQRMGGKGMSTNQVTDYYCELHNNPKFITRQGINEIRRKGIKKGILPDERASRGGRPVTAPADKKDLPKHDNGDTVTIRGKRFSIEEIPPTNNDK